MSRTLPDRPNLEHLKRQAKDAREELRRRDPGAKLADAQRAIAAAYGFASWAALKTHVLAVTIEAEPAAPVGVSPLAGGWVVDLTRSRLTAHDLRSARLHFDIDGDAVTIRHLVLDAAGRQDHGTYILRVDGERRSTSAPGSYDLTAQWDGSRALETLASAAGVVVGRARYEVDADGATLTVRSVGAEAFGRGWAADEDQLIVFVRV
jgi:hypothetical protein